MFGGKPKKIEGVTVMTPSEKLAECKKTFARQSKDLHEANNQLREDLRYWKSKYRELETELELIKAGAISEKQRLEEVISALNTKIEKLEKES